MSPFQKELEVLINHHSMENGCNTPDFILAAYLSQCLAAFDAATNQRDRWYGRPKAGPETAELLRTIQGREG